MLGRGAGELIHEAEADSALRLDAIVVATAEQKKAEAVTDDHRD